MNIKSVALVFGATMALVAGGMGAVACSSSSNSGGSSSGSGSSGGSSGSSSGSTGDDGGDGGTGTTCDSSIPSLHANNPGDVYCGYTSDDSGTPLDCVVDAGQGFCCLGGGIGGNQFAPQMCAANAAGCTNGGSVDAGGSAAIPIQCNQISDCPLNGSTGATACCIQNASAPAAVPGCGYSKAKGGSAVVCEGSGGGAATACQAGEVQICSSQTDCPSGTTCQAGKWKIYQIGFCLP
ncbi:MAG TPA: hypothetical protein VMI75_13635 [Polyangiaceae bacterium]|nr:hypothetical protein [Polyangiaceae bacterium]